MTKTVLLIKIGLGSPFPEILPILDCFPPCPPFSGPSARAPSLNRQFKAAASQHENKMEHDRVWVEQSIYPAGRKKVSNMNDDENIAVWEGWNAVQKICQYINLPI